MQTISEIMTKDVEILNPNADLVEIAQQMKKQDVGILPISDGRKLHGIVTKSDVVIRALAKNRDPHSTRASDVMTRDVDFIFEDQSAEEAAEIMQRKKVSHLLVLDKQKNLAGIVSMDDLPVAAPTHPIRSRVEEVLRSNMIGIRPRALRRLRLNTGTGIGLLSATLLTVGFLVFRRRLGMQELLTGNKNLGERDIKAA